jgi:putative transposase
MAFVRSHKIRLYPTAEQEIYFRKACGCARFAYNWGLEEWKRQYDAGKKPCWHTLRKQFDAIKRDKFPFVMEVTKCAVNQPFTNLGTAFSAFFAGRTGYPTFKKKGIRDSFYIETSSARFSGMNIRIARVGWVKMAEERRFDGHVN